MAIAGASTTDSASPNRLRSPNRSSSVVVSLHVDERAVDVEEPFCRVSVGVFVVGESQRPVRVVFSKRLVAVGFFLDALSESAVGVEDLSLLVAVGFDLLAAAKGTVLVEFEQ
ncbi:hypothetical protein VB773_13660 [Haloarculaceae archaeon H-GB2-1]|nr:hypothetical protein [Haloarculaceae archaeon H-GB2-1]